MKKFDEIDRAIIEMLQKDPMVTHSQMAKELERSQPAIGSRIKRLVDQGILATQIGVDFTAPEVSSQINLLRVELHTINPIEIFSLAKDCPYIINLLKTSGEYNIMALMGCSSLKRLDIIIDRHFRSNPNVKKIRVDLITGHARKLVLPMDFEAEMYRELSDPCRPSECSPNPAMEDLDEMDSDLQPENE